MPECMIINCRNEVNEHHIICADCSLSIDKSISDANEKLIIQGLEKGLIAKPPKRIKAIKSMKLIISMVGLNVKFCPKCNFRFIRPTRQWPNVSHFIREWKCRCGSTTLGVVFGGFFGEKYVEAVFQTGSFRDFKITGEWAL